MAVLNVGTRRRRVNRVRVCLLVLLALIFVDVVIQSYLSLVTPSGVSFKATSVRSNAGPVRLSPNRHDEGAGPAIVPRAAFRADTSGEGPVEVGAVAALNGDLDERFRGAVDGLVLTSLSPTTYEVKLNTRPRDDVAITLSDESGCFARFSPSGLVFTPANWATARVVQIELSDSDWGNLHADTCKRGSVLHEVFSTDAHYDGLFVRGQPLVGFSTDSDETGEEPLPRESNAVLTGEAKSKLEQGGQKAPPLDSQTRRTQGNLRSGQAHDGATTGNGTASRPGSPSAKSEPLGANQGVPVGQAELPALSAFAGDVSATLGAYNCSETKLPNRAIKCALAAGTSFATSFYVISAPKLVDIPDKRAALAMIVGGVHGRELAGFEAAGIIKTWTPRAGRLIVIDKLNRRGIERHTRYVPEKESAQDHILEHEQNLTSSSHHDDLNRDFPADVGLEPTTLLSHSIWELCRQLKPKLFLDLHEGWGYYAQLKRNEKHIDESDQQQLLSNPKFSKGSSVIATPNALPMAELMVSAMNAHIKDHNHHFEVLSPPIVGGLARRLYNAYQTQALVLETTQLNQALEKRVHQHLEMVSALLSRIGFLPKDFHVGKVKLRRAQHQDAKTRLHGPDGKQPKGDVKPRVQAGETKARRAAGSLSTSAAAEQGL